MSLKSIITDLASEGGIRANDPEQLALLTFRINKAAEELYNQNDLIGCLREQVFNVSTNAEGMQITMPSHVGRIRAVRYYYPSIDLKMVDMRPKYASKFWQTKNFISWRLKGESPLQVDITNASLVTVTFSNPCPEAVTVTIEGTIEGASGLTQEKLEFAIGDTTLTTLLSWETITNIVKSNPTTYDCNVTDVDNRSLALVPNNQLRSLYQWFQVMNLPNNTNGGQQTTYLPITDYVEVLWKQRFRPFIHQEDEFICPWYDQAIIWMYKKQKALQQAESDPNFFIAAKGFQTQCDKIIQDVAHESDQNLEKYMNFGSNQFLSAFENMSNNALGNYPYANGGGGIVWP